MSAPPVPRFNMRKTERRTKQASEENAFDLTVKPSAETIGESPLSLSEIKELIELIADKQFDEFELERAGFRLRLRKGGSKVISESATPTATPAAPAETIAAPLPAAPIAAAPAPAPTPPPAPPEEEKLHIVTAPIVGTFYRSPSPTAESFVKVGDFVEVNAPVCIIEAMKLMNTIESDASGTIAKIFVENGQPVEYGQPLFGLKV
jgi:acetyl-CoA carboxylase biotin carboxyl carrier protein